MYDLRQYRWFYREAAEEMKDTIFNYFSASCRRVDLMRPKSYEKIVL